MNRDHFAAEMFSTDDADKNYFLLFTSSVFDYFLRKVFS